MVEVVAGMYGRGKQAQGIPVLWSLVRPTLPEREQVRRDKLAKRPAMTSRIMQSEKAVTLVQDQLEGGCGLKNRMWISVKYIIGEVLLFWLVALFVCLLSGSGQSFCRSS